jgi:cysteine-rich repeat protein
VSCGPAGSCACDPAALRDLGGGAYALPIQRIGGAPACQIHAFGTALAARVDGSQPSCGDRIIDVGEDCDPGPDVPGDCCSSRCSFEPDGRSCDDSDACTLLEECHLGRCLGSAAPQSDEDGLGDSCDNCPYEANAQQSDADGDGDGDACECGDVDESGIPDAADLDRMRRALAGVQFQSGFSADKASVRGGLEFDVVDVALMARHVRGLPPPLEPVCEPAAPIPDDPVEPDQIAALREWLRTELALNDGVLGRPIPSEFWCTSPVCADGTFGCLIDPASTAQ